MCLIYTDLSEKALIINYMAAYFCSPLMLLLCGNLDSDDISPGKPFKANNDPPIYDDSQLEFLIDPILYPHDVNNDGMINYAEFIAAQIKNQKDREK